MRLSLIAGLAIAAVLAALAPVLPHAFSDDPAVLSRATAVLLWLALAILPGSIAFAYDGVLIGLGDYRFLGLAALGYLVAVGPLGVVTLVAGLGIAGIWGTYGCGCRCGRCATTGAPSAAAAGAPGDGRR